MELRVARVAVPTHPLTAQQSEQHGTNLKRTTKITGASRTEVVSAETVSYLI